MNLTNKRIIPFAGLHNHTEYSNMRMNDSITKLEDLIKTAQEYDYSGIVYTDHDCLSAAVRVEELRDKYNSNSFKVGFGNEIYLTESKEIENIDKFYHFLLIARTKTGYKYLKQLSSSAWKRSKFKKGIRRVPTFYSDVESIIKEKGHLIASTACLGSEFATLVTNYISTKNAIYKNSIIDFLEWCISIFGKEYFYIEIQSSINPEQIEYNKMAVKIAKSFGIKIVLTEDTHYLRAEDKNIHKSFVNSTQANNEDEDKKDFYEGCYLKSEKELRERLNYLSEEDFIEVCTNTVNIVNSIEEYSIKQPTEVPERPYPNNFVSKELFKNYYAQYPFIEKYAHSNFISDKFFLKQIEDGFIDKKLPLDETYLSRLNIELDTLWYISNELNQRLSAYYSLVNYIMELIWTKGDSIIGVGRGSACGMLICYLLNITQLDPIKYNLPYWRHLNKSRTELPDCDFDSEKNKRQNIIEILKQEFGEDRVLGVATFRTESSKSAILTACRGMDIPLETAQELADLIPVERGKVWSISECINGDGEEKKPITVFIKKISEYPNLLDTVIKIEGLISGYGSHASGMLIFPKTYIEQGSWMYTPNGLAINCFELHDAEKCASLKFDLLSVENLDIIHETMNLLIQDGAMKNCGSLKKNYDTYLHPDVLDYDTSEMFRLLYDTEDTDVFQLSTDLAKKACKLLKPKSLKEMSLINSVMRLMGDGKSESPIMKYNRFKNDISLWYKEMEEAGLSKKEQSILEKYLIPSSGMAICQETVMLLSMDKEISNFTMGESNALRKSIAKKKADLIQKSKDLFYEKGTQCNTSKKFLDYVWNVQISLSLGYSFSDLHCMVYSCIALQQLNLLYHYSAIYSQCATLLVNSSSNEGNENDSVDYGKMATSVCQAKNSHIAFNPISINSASIGFVPNVETQSIMSGLKGITNVNNDFANTIINNRPYSSVIDFINKTQPTKLQMISLIKAGAFDEFDSSRFTTMKKYINYLAKQANIYKDKLNGTSYNELNDLRLLSEEWRIFVRYYNFNKYITSEEFVFSKENKKTWLIAKDIGKNFFEQYYINDLKEEQEYYYTKDGIVFSKTAYNKVYKKRMVDFNNFVNSESFLEKYNNIKNINFCNEIWDKYCKGSNEDWEFDAYNYYIKDHALANLNIEKYNISSFKNLPTQPIIEEEYEWHGKTCYNYKLARIAGTVLDCDRNKHTITLLTNFNEVVKVKYYAGQFINYNTKITEKINGKSVTKDESWFKRGTKLVLVGYRMDDMFKAKANKKSIYKHSTALIESYEDNGNIIIRELRYGEKEKIW